MREESKDRRARGDGSLTLRPNAKGGETWIAFWRIDGRGVTRSLGPKRSKAQPEGLTPAQAERRFAEAREQARLKPERTVAGKTLRDAGDGLYRAKRAAGRKPTTLEGIEYSGRVHVDPFFGSTPVSKITREQVESFRDHLIEDKGLAPKSAANILGVLHGMFEYAIDQGWSTGENPVKKVAKPRSNAPVDFSFLTAEEVEALLRLVPDTQVGRVDRAMYLTAAQTGLRQGELLALRWSDIRFVEQRVHVLRNYVRETFQTPKSGKGRSVPMTPKVLAALEDLQRSSVWDADDDLVFAHPDTGAPMERSRLLKRFKSSVLAARVGRFERVVDAAGKPKVDGDGNPVERPVLRFHDLRHTFGTQLARQGVAMRKIQEYMGHADFQTTLIYSHFAPGHGDADEIAEAFAPLVAADAVETEEAESGASVADEIRRVAGLHRDGILSDEQFEDAKERLLARL